MINEMVYFGSNVSGRYNLMCPSRVKKILCSQFYSMGAWVKLLRVGGRITHKFTSIIIYSVNWKLPPTGQLARNIFTHPRVTRCNLKISILQFANIKHQNRHNRSSYSAIIFSLPLQVNRKSLDLSTFSFFPKHFATSQDDTHLSRLFLSIVAHR